MTNCINTYALSGVTSHPHSDTKLMMPKGSKILGITDNYVGLRIHVEMNPLRPSVTRRIRITGYEAPESGEFIGVIVDDMIFTTSTI